MIIARDSTLPSNCTSDKKLATQKQVASPQGVPTDEGPLSIISFKLERLKGFSSQGRQGRHYVRIASHIEQTEANPSTCHISEHSLWAKKNRPLGAKSSRTSAIILRTR